MVLVVYLVGFALVGAFLVAIVGSAQVSDTTRSGIQAEAAAEAGLAAAINNIDDGNPCVFGGVNSTVEPKYVVTADLQHCNDANTPSITLVSSGTSGTTVRQIEARFEVDLPDRGPVQTASLYIAGSTAASGSLQGLNVSSGASPAPSIVVSNGNFSCGGSHFTAPGDLIIAAGTATLGSNNCTVKGDIYASGNVVTGFGNEILGSIHSGGSVTVETQIGSSASPKDVFATGSVNIHNSGRLRDVQAGGNLTNRGVVAGNAAVKGSLVSVDDPGAIGGKLTVGANVPPVDIYTPEEVPAWIDYSFRPTDWPTSSWKYLTWSSSDCTTFSQSASTWDAITADGKNTLIDARNCLNGFSTSTWGAANIKLKADLAILMKKGTFANGPTIRSGDGAAHGVYVITPDEKPTEAGPNCPTGGGKITLSALKVLSPVTINVYTPCGVTLQNAVLRGGLFVNGVTMDWGVSSLDALPISMPGAEFGDGGSAGGSTEAGTPILKRSAPNVPPTPISQRDID